MSATTYRENPHKDGYDSLACPECSGLRIFSWEKVPKAWSIAASANLDRTEMLWDYTSEETLTGADEDSDGTFADDLQCGDCQWTGCIADLAKGTL